MSADTYSNADVAKLTNERFVSVKVDTDRHEALWKRFNTAGGGIPATYFVDGDGATVSSLGGYVDASSYIEALKRIPAAWPKLKDAQAAVEKSPDDVATLAALAEIYVDLARDAEAAALYGRIAPLLEAKKVDDAERKLLATAYYRLVKAYAELEEPKWKEARAAMAKYAALDPDNRFAYADDFVCYEAIAQAEEGDTDAALRTIEAGMAKHPDSNVADWMGFLKGAILHEKGEHEKAVEAWKATAAKFPDTRFGRRSRQAAEHGH